MVKLSKNSLNLFFVFIILVSCNFSSNEIMYLKIKVKSPWEKQDRIIRLLLLQERNNRKGNFPSDSFFDGYRYNKLNQVNSYEGYPNIPYYLKDWFDLTSNFFEYPIENNDSFFVYLIAPSFLNCNYCMRRDSIYFLIYSDFYIKHYHFAIPYQKGDTVIKEILLENFHLEY